MIAPDTVGFIISAVLVTCGAANELAVTYKVDCLSPSIAYDPHPIGKSTVIYNPSPELAGIEVQGWDPNHEGNAWNSSFDYTLNLLETVRSEWGHYTWATFIDGMVPPSARLMFIGRQVTVFGPPPGSLKSGYGMVELILDGRTAGSCSVDTDTDTEPVRCSCTADYGRHTLTVVVRFGTFAIEHFEVSTGIDEEDGPIRADLANENLDLNIDGKIVTASSGLWQVTSDPLPLHRDLKNMPQWSRAYTTSYGASLSLNVPNGTSRVSIFGAVGMDHERFFVTFTPDIFGQRGFLCDSWCLWSVQNFSIFDAILDPNVTYQMEVTKRGRDGVFLEVSHFEFYRPKLNATSDNATSDATWSVGSSSKSSGGLSGGAIAGIVVGGVAGVALAAVVGWAIHRIRQRRPSHNPVNLDTDEDHIVDHRIEPYDDHAPHGGLGATLASVHPDSATPSSDSSSPPAANSTPSATSKSYLGSLTPLTVQNPGSSANSAIGVRVVTAKESSPVTVQQVHHTDGGAMPQHQSAVIVEETPPTYNTNWTGSIPAGAEKPVQPGSPAPVWKPETTDPASSAS